MKIFHKSNKKQILIFAIILILLLSPIFTFNYLLYKDKGIVDVQFSRFTGIGKETYASIEGTMKPFRFRDLFLSYPPGHKPGIYEGLRFYWMFGIVTFLLGIMGIIPSFKKNFKSSLFLSLIFIFPFIFLAGTSILPYHFCFGVPIFALFGANALSGIQNKISKVSKINKKTVLYVLLGLIVISSLFIANNNGSLFKGKSEVAKMMDYTENIEDNALVVVDSRVYRGRIAWIFNNNHYLEAVHLENLFLDMEQLPGERVNLPVYFIECVTDDCGWGSIASQPELNQSMEGVVNLFNNITTPIKEITTNSGETYFRVYKTELPLKYSALGLADLTHSWFYYPVRYKAETWFDKYETKGAFDNLLDLIAHLILYIAILIAILSIFYTFYLLIEEDGKT